MVSLSVKKRSKKFSRLGTCKGEYGEISELSRRIPTVVHEELRKLFELEIHKLQWSEMYTYPN